MVVALVLARLLSPHDWGLAAMVLVFAGFVVVFTDNALGTALIQRRELLRGRPLDRLLGQRRASASLLALAGIAFAGPLAASTASRRCAGSSSPFSVGLPRQRAGHDPDGAARTRDGVPEARAAADRRDARRRRASESRIALVGLRRLGDRRPAARGGGRPRPSLLWLLTPWRPSFALLDGQLAAASADSPATSSQRTCSGRRAEPSSAS